MTNISIDAALQAVVRNRIGLDHPAAAEIIQRYKTHVETIKLDGSLDDAAAFQKVMHDLGRELYDLKRG